MVAHAHSRFEFRVSHPSTHSLKYNTNKATVVCQSVVEHGWNRNCGGLGNFLSFSASDQRLFSVKSLFFISMVFTPEGDYATLYNIVIKQ
jgi:hypothetical protein